MAELVDAHGSGPCAARRGGSSPLLGTKFPFQTVLDDPETIHEPRESGVFCWFGVLRRPARVVGIFAGTRREHFPALQFGHRSLPLTAMQTRSLPDCGQWSPSQTYTFWPPGRFRLAARSGIVRRARMPGNGAGFPKKHTLGYTAQLPSIASQWGAGAVWLIGILALRRKACTKKRQAGKPKDRAYLGG